MNDNLKQLQDDILDKYNENKISEKEMKNILKWTEKSHIKKEGNCPEFKEKYYYENH